MCLCVVLFVFGCKITTFCHNIKHFAYFLKAHKEAIFLFVDIIQSFAYNLKPISRKDVTNCKIPKNYQNIKLFILACIIKK